MCGKRCPGRLKRWALPSSPPTIAASHVAYLSQCRIPTASTFFHLLPAKLEGNAVPLYRIIQPGSKRIGEAIVGLHRLQKHEHAPLLVPHDAEPLVNGLQLQLQVLQARHFPGGGTKQLKDAAHRPGLLQDDYLPHGFAHHEAKCHAIPREVLVPLHELFQVFDLVAMARAADPGIGPSSCGSELASQGATYKVFLEGEVRKLHQGAVAPKQATL